MSSNLVQELLLHQLGRLVHRQLLLASKTASALVDGAAGLPATAIAADAPAAAAAALPAAVNDRPAGAVAAAAKTLSGGVPRCAHEVTDLAHYAAGRAALSFELTAAQQRVLEEVLGDLAGPSPMFRLLQARCFCCAARLRCAVAWCCHLSYLPRSSACWRRCWATWRRPAPCSDCCRHSPTSRLLYMRAVPCYAMLCHALPSEQPSRNLP